MNKNERALSMYTNTFTIQCESSIAFPTRRLRLTIALIMIIIKKR